MSAQKYMMMWRQFLNVVSSDEAVVALAAVERNELHQILVHLQLRILETIWVLVESIDPNQLVVFVESYHQP